MRENVKLKVTLGGGGGVGNFAGLNFAYTFYMCVPWKRLTHD